MYGHRLGAGDAVLQEAHGAILTLQCAGESAMNLLLLREEDFREDGTVRLTGRRLLHAREVLRAAAGDALRIGRMGGLLGSRRGAPPRRDRAGAAAGADRGAPPRAGVDLLLAIPRPKALRKMLPAAASLGVDRIVLVNAARVEKSYFGSGVLSPGSVEKLLVLGLEQARDTRLPEVLVRERFRPFVEDELDGLWPDTSRLVAHPGAPPAPARIARPGRARHRPRRRLGALRARPHGGARLRRLRPGPAHAARRSRRSLRAGRASLNHGASLLAFG